MKSNRLPHVMPEADVERCFDRLRYRRGLDTDRIEEAIDALEAHVAALHQHGAREVTGEQEMIDLLRVRGFTVLGPGRTAEAIAGNIWQAAFYKMASHHELCCLKNSNDGLYECPYRADDDEFDGCVLCYMAQAVALAEEECALSQQPSDDPHNYTAETNTCETCKHEASCRNVHNLSRCWMDASKSHWEAKDTPVEATDQNAEVA